MVGILLGRGVVNNLLVSQVTLVANQQLIDVLAGVAINFLEYFNNKEHFHRDCGLVCRSAVLTELCSPRQRGATTGRRNDAVVPSSVQQVLGTCSHCLTLLKDSWSVTS